MSVAAMHLLRAADSSCCASAKKLQLKLQSRQLELALLLLAGTF
jgi:hypothetical protein